MDRTLSVLIVEDSESDAELLVGHLERAGYVLSYDRVETAEEMGAALDKQEWDIIIADHAMPGFDAPAALRLLRASGRDLPFIVVSGAIGEDTAVALMKAGAHDCVMKDNLTRLAPTVRRELDDAEVRRKRRRAEEALRRSEERYRAVYEENPSMYFTMDAAGTVLSVNWFGAEQLGYTVEELVGQPVLKVFHPDDREAVREQFVRCLQSPRQVTHWEFRKVRRDGSVLWVKEAARAVHEPGGNPVVLVVCEDITERKRAEEELFNSRQMLQLVLDNIPQRIFWKDRNSVYLGSNKTLAQDCGYNDPSELIGKTDYETASATTADLYRADDREVMETGRSKLNYEEPQIKPDGSQAWLRTSKVPLRDKGGRIIAVLGMYEDITERKRAEEELFNSRQMLQLVLDNIPQRIFWKDRDSVYLGSNKTLAQDCGYQDPSELIGKTDYETASAATAGLYRADDREVMETGRPKLNYEEPQIKPDGSQAWLRTSKVPLRDKEGRIIAVLGMYEDITERKKAEEERARLVTAIEQSAEAIFIADRDWIIHYVNPAFERVSGYGRSEIVGQHVRALESAKQDKPFYDRIRATLDQGEVWTGRIINKKKNGTFYHAEATASPVRDHSGAIINYVAVQRDITHEVMIERQLRQAQKMEAIGTLAGGIAHDFNNILAAIVGFTEIAMGKVPQGSPVQHDLEQVLNASSRATDLVRQILTVSRQTEQELRPVQITPTVKEVLKLLRSSLPTTIDIHQEIAIPPEGGVVLADLTQIHQVLMNLCTNAAHAMRSTGGILSVGLSGVEADSSFVANHPGLKAGPCLCLTVSDTGHGMDAAVLERVFEPYFTTKGAGEGTGLGLAVVEGIVRGCGGAVTVDSEPGHGTTFRVYLPTIEREIAPEPRPVEPLPLGNERILFVDDESAIVDLGKRMLESLGYEVTAKTSSFEALETFRAQPDAFDLVITDMTMPAPTGIELAKEMMAIRPDTPIILCTGFSELINAKQAKEAGIREFVMKPFVARTFTKTIRKVLEET